MVTKPILLCLILSFSILVQSNVILDVWGDHSTAFFQCLRAKGYNQIMLNLNSRAAGINQQDIQNLLNAKNAGFDVQPAMTPCRIFSPAH